MPEPPPEATGVDAPDLTDAELARRIAAARPGEAGDEEAELCERYGRRIVYFGRRRLGSDDAARDLAQDTLLLTLEKLRAGAVRDPERIGAFILGVARTLSTARLSRGGRLRSIEDLPREPTAPVVALPDPIARSRVAPCLETLPDRQRAVVLLTFYAEHDSGEIARALGLSSGNVRVLRHRGVSQLRDCLDAADTGEMSA